MNRRIIAAAALAAAAALLTACGSSSTPAPQPRDTITEDGTYAVGVDVLPGTYAARAPEKGVDPLLCTWQLKSSAGTLLQDQTNLGGSAPDRVVELSAGQSFTTSHCGLWLPA